MTKHGFGVFVISKLHFMKRRNWMDFYCFNCPIFDFIYYIYIFDLTFFGPLIVADNIKYNRYKPPNNDIISAWLQFRNNSKNVI